MRTLSDTQILADNRHFRGSIKRGNIERYNNPNFPQFTHLITVESTASHLELDSYTGSCSASYLYDKNLDKWVLGAN